MAQWRKSRQDLVAALKLILGKKYHWQLDRFSFLALPGYLNIKPLIMPAVKDTLEKKWWWGNVFDLKEEPIYTFLTRLTPGGLMEWCAWFNWKAEQAPRPTNQPSRPHNLDPTFFTSEDTQWAGWLIKEKFCTVSMVKSPPLSDWYTNIICKELYILQCSILYWGPNRPSWELLH